MTEYSVIRTECGQRNKMLNTRCCSSLDDLPIEILTQIIVMLGSKKMYAAEEECDVFKQASLDMFEGMDPKDLKDDVFTHKCATHKNVEAIVISLNIGVEECFGKGNFDLEMSLLGDAGDKDHLEAIYFLGMIRISRGPPRCDEVN
uniref:At2g35280-like TPR domain-containing protein n=1 Tax=Lactuca sativa TaxID=4236 RepID=A0A9R1UFQ9_LACSA|nr:hypothetical protein LSAT_V11C900491870 [Lactuca sativa]